MRAFCSFLAMPASLLFLFVNSVTCSPCWFDISPFLILATLLLFLLFILHISLFYMFFVSFLGHFLFFPHALCAPVSLCDFQFQHSSLFSWFFSPFAFLFTFEYFLSLCLPLFDFMQFSLLHVFVCMCVCTLVCVCKGVS